ncbi:hypothetical protein [Tessaracoccus sp.]
MAAGLTTTLAGVAALGLATTLAGVAALGLATTLAGVAALGLTTGLAAGLTTVPGRVAVTVLAGGATVLAVRALVGMVLVAIMEVAVTRGLEVAALWVARGSGATAAGAVVFVAVLAATAVGCIWPPPLRAAE